MSLANAEHFNQKASTYDAGTEQQRFTAELQAHLRKNASWLGLDTSSKAGVKVLDYACGPGAAAFALHDYAETVLGVDISENMVSIFNERAKKAGLEHMHAVEGNLCVSEGETISDTLQGMSNYDLLIVSFGFHHFDLPGKCIKQLLLPLKQGGRLVIVDFLAHAGFDKVFGHAAPEGTLRTIGKGAEHGFSEQQIRSLFEQGGCDQVEVKPWEFQNMEGSKFAAMHPFTCRGVKQ